MINKNNPRYLNELAQLQMVEKYDVVHTINLDWFECNVSGAFIQGEDAKERYSWDNDRIVLARKGDLEKCGTKLYKYSYDVIIDGKPFGKCHCSPRAPEIIPPDTIQFQLYNHVLMRRAVLQI